MYILSLTINLHHTLSTVVMDNPAVLTDFARNTIGVTTKQLIEVIINVVESFRDLLYLNDDNIDTFVKDTHSANNAIAAGQRMLISNNVTQGFKSMFL